MEPDDVAEYARPEYWDKRYETEAQYDWFTSVYELVVDQLLKVVQQLHDDRRNAIGLPEPGDEHRNAAAGKLDGDEIKLRVLHLGCGNSALCRDLANKCAESGVFLDQVAVDYSAVVIDRMRETDRTPGVEWLQADVRRLESLPTHSFDLIIDKGTMDALQADKENPNLDEDIDAMLLEVSRLLKQSRRSVFVQVTWEIPYYRYHYTKRIEYAWGGGGESALSTFKLGGSDLYRFYRYDVAAASTPIISTTSKESVGQEASS